MADASLPARGTGATGAAEAGGRAGCVVHCLTLAAAPTFVIMAMVTGMIGGGVPGVLCSAAPDTSPLTGMIPMYLLMSVFHAAPWLKLVASRGS